MNTCKKKSKKHVLYLSYNGLLEPILASQAIPYLRHLSAEGFGFILLTYEKKKDIDRAGRKEIKRIDEELKSYDIEWHYLRYHKNPPLVSTLFDLVIGIFYCAYLIPMRKIEIVHVRGVTPGSIMLVLSMVFRSKILFDMRGRLAEEMAAGGLWGEQGIRFRLIKLAERRLLKIADAVTMLTHKHLELDKDRGPLKDRDIPADVIPCCVDMDRFNYNTNTSEEIKNRLGLEGKFILMYPGKIGTFYLIDHMLDFYKKMAEIIPNTVFVILTSDKADTVLENSRARGIGDDSIKIIQGTGFDEIPNYLQIADAGIFFINPHNKLGSSPIKMGEFLACGIPVIINPGVGDTEGMVNENRVGVVVKDFSGSHYEKAVRELMRLKSERDTLRKRCRDTAGRYLALDEGVKRYRAIYKSLLNAEKPRMLFLVPYPTEGASNRVRIEQFIPYLQSKGVVCKVRPFVNNPFYKILYEPKKFLQKLFWFSVCTVNRLFDVIRVFGYDIIIIHREAYPIGRPFLERVISALGKPIIYDFDDAIFLPSTSKQNIYIEKFKRPSKVAKIIKMSRLVIAGNEYLRDYALKYNPKVIVIPSSVDTEKYSPLAGPGAGNVVIIGWIGSNTTKEFLYDLEDVFVELNRRHKNLVFKIIGAKFKSEHLNNVINVKWSLDNEAEEIQSFDIGIMPMPDNEWTRGKCGFKALLYMACGIPVIASPVGVNTRIIAEGVDGYLAERKDEWVDKISALVNNQNMRRTMGGNGREKVVSRYSLATTAPIFYEEVVRQMKGAQ